MSNDMDRSSQPSASKAQALTALAQLVEWKALDDEIALWIPDSHSPTLYELRDKRQALETAWDDARALLAASTVEPPTLGDLHYFQSALDRKDALLRQAVEAQQALIEWDKARDFPVPYKVRDPIHAAIAAITKELEQPK